jgi:hypothetical protein
MPGRSQNRDRGIFVAGQNSDWNVRYNTRTAKYDLHRTKDRKIFMDIPTRKLALEMLEKKLGR